MVSSTIRGRIRRDRRVSLGLCRDCGKNPLREVRNFSSRTKVRCLECAQKHSQKNKEKRNRLKQAGLCTRCGKNLLVTKILCEICRLDNASKGRKFRKRKSFFYKRAVNGVSGQSGAINMAVALRSLWKTQRGRCAATGARLNRENCELDHIIPRSKGGKNEIGNFRWVLKDVNRAKWNLSSDQFLALCMAVVEFSKAKNAL